MNDEFAESYGEKATAELKPLIVLFGPTASGKTELSLRLAEAFGGEVVSCDSVAVYRGMELGTAKPSAAERARVRHHCLDLYEPTEACTAGDYARHARRAIEEISGRCALPILSGGTGLYGRALLDGLAPTPPADAGLRSLLRARAARRGAVSLHRTLRRLDAVAAARIHAHDMPKMIRAIEVSIAARRPLTELWSEGRDALTGYGILRLGLLSERAALNARIDVRAAVMFARGLVDELRELRERYGAACRPFGSLGYAEAGALLDGTLTEAEAVSRAQQGHRNYAKRQVTWFRREGELHTVHWLRGTGDAAAVQAEAGELVRGHVGSGW